MYNKRAVMRINMAKILNLISKNEMLASCGKLIFQNRLISHVSNHKTGRVFALACCFSMASYAAEVEYSHPMLRISAENESLQSVLMVLGKEMQISISRPLNFNPNVSCETGDRSVPKALRTLLRDVSYSLEWEPDGERLSAIVIFGSTDKEIDEQNYSTSEKSVSVVFDDSGSARASAINDQTPQILNSDNDVMTSLPSEMGLARDDQEDLRRQQEEGIIKEREEREARHQEARLEEEAKTREDDINYEARERALFSNGTPEL